MSNEQYARTGRAMFILAWLIFFVILFLFFHYYGQEKESKYTLENGRLIIDANRQGHYFVTGSINEYPVKFMLDTGATLVAVPKDLASKMQLKGRYPVTMHTANGQITGLLTRLDELSFGKFTINNVKAVIIPKVGNETVLMGMNVLSQFDLNQKGGKLIISHTNDE